MYIQCLWACDASQQNKGILPVCLPNCSSIFKRMVSLESLIHAAKFSKFSKYLLLIFCYDALSHLSMRMYKDISRITIIFFSHIYKIIIQTTFVNINPITSKTRNLCQIFSHHQSMEELAQWRIQDPFSPGCCTGVQGAGLIAEV